METVSKLVSEAFEIDTFNLLSLEILFLDDICFEPFLIKDKILSELLSSSLSYLNEESDEARVFADFDT